MEVPTCNINHTKILKDIYVFASYFSLDVLISIEMIVLCQSVEQIDVPNFHLLLH